mmetsp:Transcript_86927/g.278909  ORF Transcript_86927/g.278909 Transcript_86927/m.278909 type:complete len:320 (+) Transcript_86927:55-1014(+)
MLVEALAGNSARSKAPPPNECPHPPIAASCPAPGARPNLHVVEHGGAADGFVELLLQFQDLQVLFAELCRCSIEAVQPTDVCGETVSLDDGQDSVLDHLGDTAEGELRLRQPCMHQRHLDLWHTDADGHVAQHRLYQAEGEFGCRRVSVEGSIADRAHKKYVRSSGRLSVVIQYLEVEGFANHCPQELDLGCAFVGLLGDVAPETTHPPTRQPSDLESPRLCGDGGSENRYKGCVEQAVRSGTMPVAMELWCQLLCNDEAGRRQGGISKAAHLWFRLGNSRWIGAPCHSIGVGWGTAQLKCRHFRTCPAWHCFHRTHAC